MNQSQGTLQARIGLSSQDIPLTCDPAWERVDDPAAFEAAHPHLIRLSKDVPTAENFALDLLSVEELQRGGGGT